MKATFPIARVAGAKTAIVIRALRSNPPPTGEPCNGIAEPLEQNGLRLIDMRDKHARLSPPSSFVEHVMMSSYTQLKHVGNKYSNIFDVDSSLKEALDAAIANYTAIACRGGRGFGDLMRFGSCCSKNACVSLGEC